MKKGSARGIVRFLIIILILAAAAGGGYWYWQQSGHAEASYQTQYEAENKYVRLDMEAYDAIKERYWQEVEDAALAELYQLSLAKALNRETMPLATTTRNGVAEMLNTAFAEMPNDEARKELALRTITIVLHNLAPQGRSQLYTQKEETDMRNRVANVNPEKNLYEDLGLSDGAGIAAVQEAYEARRAELEASTSTDAQEALARAAYAHDVLADETTKTLYDTEKVEPTVIAKWRGSDTLYVNFKQIAPTSLKEFVDQIIAKTDGEVPPNLIIDLRGNAGGSLDFAPYFLGVFMGPNQYAADLFKQGEREAMRTPENIPAITELQGFKEIAILTDGGTQSTAELTAAIFKRQNLATVVGTKTKGWGTVENTFPLETELTEGEQYVLFLVHSLTLRDDQQPVEGNGVIPDISVAGENWESQLADRFDSSEMRSALVEILSAT